MRRFITASSLLALAAACGGEDSTQLAGGAPTEETIAVAQLELRGSLPSCNRNATGNVYYIVRDEQLVYCDGKSYQDVGLPCDPTWLVSAGAAMSCAYGGATLSAGPDNNGNGKLDKKEVVSTASACNGAPGAAGPAGATGATGATGAVGATGASGAQGPAGADGKNGANGADGATGKDGADGKDGANGSDGSSCSVADNGDGTYTLSCTDGTSVTLRDGADGANGSPGATGPQGPVGPQGESGAAEANIVAYSSGTDPIVTNTAANGGSTTFAVLGFGASQSYSVGSSGYESQLALSTPIAFAAPEDIELTGLTFTYVPATSPLPVPLGANLYIEMMVYVSSGNAFFNPRPATKTTAVIAAPSSPGLPIFSNGGGVTGTASFNVPIPRGSRVMLAIRHYMMDRQTNGPLTAGASQIPASVSATLSIQ